MIYCVVTKNLNQFNWHFHDKFNLEDVSQRSPGKMIMNNGDEYRYISGERNLRGLRGVEVLFWGQWPEWYSKDINRADLLIQHVRMK